MHCHWLRYRPKNYESGLVPSIVRTPPSARSRGRTSFANFLSLFRLKPIGGRKKREPGRLWGTTARVSPGAEGIVRSFVRTVPCARRALQSATDFAPLTPPQPGPFPASRVPLWWRRRGVTWRPPTPGAWACRSGDRANGGARAPPERLARRRARRAIGRAAAGGGGPGE